jgi:hypothetical protein
MKNKMETINNTSLRFSGPRRKRFSIDILPFPAKENSKALWFKLLIGYDTKAAFSG